jgi:cytochrome b561
MNGMIHTNIVGTHGANPALGVSGQKEHLWFFWLWYGIIGIHGEHIVIVMDGDKALQVMCLEVGGFTQSGHDTHIPC